MTKPQEKYSVSITQDWDCRVGITVKDLSVRHAKLIAEYEACPLSDVADARWEWDEMVTEYVEDIILNTANTHNKPETGFNLTTDKFTAKIGATELAYTGEYDNGIGHIHVSDESNEGFNWDALDKQWIGSGWKIDGEVVYKETIYLTFEADADSTKDEITNLACAYRSQTLAAHNAALILSDPVTLRSKRPLTFESEECSISLEPYLAKYNDYQVDVERLGGSPWPAAEDDYEDEYEEDDEDD